MLQREQDQKNIAANFTKRAKTVRAQTETLAEGLRHFCCYCIVVVLLCCV